MRIFYDLVQPVAVSIIFYPFSKKKCQNVKNVKCMFIVVMLLATPS